MITISQIGSLLARFGNEIVNDQVNMACPFVGNGHIQKLKHTHEQGVVNIRETEGLSSTGQISDGAALPQGANVSFQRGTYLPKIFFTRLSIPRGAAHLAAGGRDGVRLVREELEVAGRQLGKVLGKAVFNAPYTLFYDDQTVPGTIDNAAAGGQVLAHAGGPVNLVCPSTAGLIAGMRIQVVDCVTGTPVQGDVVAVSQQKNATVTGAPLTFTDPNSDGCFGVTLNLPAMNILISSVVNNRPIVAFPGPGVPPATTFSTLSIHTTGPEDALLYATIPADPMVNLGQAYSPAPLYGITNTDYTGNVQAVGGALTAQAMRDMSTIIKRRAGYGWHMLVMNSNQLQNYFETTIAPNAALNYLPGSTTKDADGGATVPMFQGMPIIVDENVDDHTIFFFNKDDIKLAEFKEFGPDNDGGAEHGMVDRSRLIYDTQIWGMYNLRVQRRNSGGQLINIDTSA